MAKVFRSRKGKSWSNFPLRPTFLADILFGPAQFRPRFVVVFEPRFSWRVGILCLPTVQTVRLQLSQLMPPRPMSTRSRARKRSRVRSRTRKKDPIFVDGQRPRPMYVDYKDVELLKKMVNRQGRIVGRRKSGCTAASQHAVTAAVKRARFMALLSYVGE